MTAGKYQNRTDTRTESLNSCNLLLFDYGLKRVDSHPDKDVEMHLTEFNKNCTIACLVFK